MRFRIIRRHLTAAAVCAALALPVVSGADTAGDKARRGIASLATPFLEIPGNIVRTSDTSGALAGWTEGLARGIGMSMIRPPVGFYELVTAPFPDYEPILTPEYPWSYFSEPHPSEPPLASR